MDKVPGQIWSDEEKQCEVSERCDETRDWSHVAPRRQPEIRGQYKSGLVFQLTDSVYLIDQEEEMREEQPIRDEVVVVPQAVLEGGKGLLIVLQGVGILPCTAV